MPPAPRRVRLLLLWLAPVELRCDSMVIKGAAIQAQEDGLKAAAEGRFADAVNLLQRALKGSPEHTLEARQRVAILRNALGGALKSLGRFDEAAPRFEAALATFRAEASAAADPRSDQAEAAVVMNNLGAVRAEMGRKAEARALYDGALSLFDQVEGSNGGGGGGGGVSELRANTLQPPFACLGSSHL